MACADLPESFHFSVSNHVRRVVAAICMLALSLPCLADPAPSTLRFTIQSYDIAGNTKLSESSLKDAVAPFTGEGQDFSSIQSAISAITSLYKAAGYEAVRVVVPKQEIDDGTVHLQVIEAALGRVLVQGNKFFDESNVLHALPTLRVGETPNISKLGADLRLSNESYAKQTQVTFRQGEDPRTVDAVVNVSDDQPWHAAISLDNTGTDQTGNWRLGFAYLNANVLNLDHALAAQFVTSPSHLEDVQIFGLNYRIPLYGIGDALEFNASHSSVNSGVVNTTSGSYGINGSGDNFGVHYIHLLPRIKEWDQRFDIGVDYRHFHNGVSFVGSAGGSLIPDTEVRPLSASYEGFIRGQDREWGMQLAILHNIPGGSDGGSQAFRASRQPADTNYTMARYSFHITQTLPKNWQIHTEFNGQITNDALISGEQFGIGGVSSVRGFEERALANDKGYRATVEVHTPDFGSALHNANLKIKALAFLDAANASRNHGLDGETAHNHIASIGLGLRCSMGQHANLRFDVADTIDEGGISKTGLKKMQASFVYLF